MSTVRTVDPATGTLLAEYPAFTDADVDAALDGAAAAQTGWAARPFAERSAVLRCAGQVLRAEVDDLALLVTREMGKPLAEARAEVEKCATACDYYAEHAAEFLADEPVDTSADRSWIGYQPVGVVLAVMPWNFPLWQVLRFGSAAGDAIKKSVLELGGSDPFVVVDAAVAEEFTRLLAPRWRASPSVIARRPARTSGPWRGRTCPRGSTARSRPRSRPAPGCSPVATG
jgi:acyl-CoA reductase-like NAD-dependent aldehyde dehydrogenase